MFNVAQPFFIIAETPLHPGSGSELGIVDLPIQRERHTDYPKIEASGLKGCIKEAFEGSDTKVEINATEMNANDRTIIFPVFGPEEGDSHASAIAFIDARVLLFPVKSLKGVFGWITCPDVLERFKDDLMFLWGRNDMPMSNFQDLEYTCPDNSNLTISSKVVLEEYTFEVKHGENTKEIGRWLADKIFPRKDGTDPYKFWREKLKKDMVILPDDDFRDFVKTSTEVITRTKIDPATGTVQRRALWTEEYLPTDTILYSFALASPLRVDDNEKCDLKGQSPKDEANKVMEFFKKGCPEVIQIGGNQTIGKGFVRIQFLEGKNG